MKPRLFFLLFACISSACLNAQWISGDKLTIGLTNMGVFQNSANIGDFNLMISTPEVGGSPNSLVVGKFNQLSDPSDSCLVVGVNNVSTGQWAPDGYTPLQTSEGSATIGAGLVNEWTHCMVVGAYNDANFTEDPLFVIGSGNGTTRSNAFVVAQSGNATINGNTTVTGNLTLKTQTGSVGLTLSPTSGISLPAGRSLTLSDGTVLSNGASLHSTALYDSGGNARMTFDGSGNLVVSAPVKLEGTGAGIDFGGGSVLDQNNVTYLKQTLANLGYREPGSPVDHSFSFPFYVRKAVADTAGNIYVTGTFNGSGRLGSTTLNSIGNSDVFVAKLNGNGIVQWAKNFGGTSIESSAGLAVDGSGNAYVMGTFAGSMSSGLPQTLTSAGNADVFVVKLDGAGVVQWAKSFGGINPSGLAVDGSGNAYMTGFFAGSMSSGLPQTLTSTGSYDVFVVKLNGTGIVQWAKSFGGTGEDMATSLAVDGSGNAYVTGTFAGSMSSGLPQTLASAGSFDVFVVKLNGTGIVQWAKSFGGTGEDRGTGFAVDGSGNAYVTGTFSDSMSNGLPQTLIDAGGSNIFVAKLDGTGVVQWAKSFGGTGNDMATSLAVDGSGNAYVTGNFDGQMSSGLPQTLTDPGNGAVFVVEMDGNGTVQSAVGLGGTTDQTSFWGTTNRLTSSGVALGGGGMLILTGEAQGGINTIGDQVVDGFYVYWGPMAALASSATGTTAGFSWGSSRASSEGAVALGKNALAASTGAVALGGGASLGEYSFSTGFQSSANNYAATAFGFMSSASGNGSTASGYSATASGDGSTAFGHVVNAAGLASTAMGDMTWAGGQDSVAMGFSCGAGGGAAVAMGAQTSASGEGSVAMGESTSAAGKGSVAMGFSTSAAGEGSVAMGFSTSASGYTSTVFGLESSATGDCSTAFGLQSSASGSVSTTMGEQTKANAYASFALGRNNVGFFDANAGGNTTWNEQDPVLEIGNGEDRGTPSNALTVFKNGKVRTGNVVESKAGFRTPPQGDLSMGDFTAGQNPADLDPTLGLKYQGE